MMAGNPPPEFRLVIPGLAHPLDKRLLARRSARISRLLQAPNDPANDLEDAPPSPSAFELAAKFCGGHPPDLSPDNILAVICVASFLEMAEHHSPNNLLHQALSFFSAAVLPHWSASLRALRGGAAVIPSAAALGLLTPLLTSISLHARRDPLLLSSPLDDLTDLNLDLFLMAVNAVNAAAVDPAAVAGCIFRYARRYAGVGTATQVLDYEKNSHKRILEALEQHLPRERNSLKVKPLLQMLQSVMALGADERCRDGLEQRIGPLLAEASMEDLLIPSQGYSREIKYDVDSVERVVGHFCKSSGERKKAAKLLEEYLAEVGKEKGLRKEKFSRLLRMLSWLLEVEDDYSDGVYRAVDCFFRAHEELTESEREEICRGALDCGRLSMAACEKAAQNERLPLRVVAQVLCKGQMYIREAIAGAMRDDDEEDEDDDNDDDDKEKEMENEVEEREMVVCAGCEGRRKRKRLGFFWRMFGCRDVRVACTCDRKKG